MLLSRQNLRVMMLIVAWYTSSTFQNIWSKSLLQKFPYPMTLTLAQFTVLALTMPLLIQVHGKRRRTFSNKQYYGGLLPLCVLKLISSLSSFFTLLKVPVSYAHTVKALLPLFTVSLTRAFLGTQYSWKVYGSLLPIVGGVIITSATQLEFNAVGLFAALFSTGSLSVQSIFSKQMMKGVDHLNLLLGTAHICMMAWLPIWFFLEGYSMVFGDLLARFSVTDLSAMMLELIGASACNCAQTIFAFTFLSLVQPVSYSVANVSKRIVVILISILWFRNKASSSNSVGMAIAIFGVALYNKIKLDEATASSPTLPKTIRDLPWRGRAV